MSEDTFREMASAKRERPEPNVEGSFACMDCGEPVSFAYYDRASSTLYWWCSEDHQSAIEKFTL